MKGLVIGAVHSGSGKTTVSLGLMAALKRRGLRVAPFKVGPDFIDPGRHREITGAWSRNLDGWMLSRECNRSIFSRNAAGADIAVVEGVMGLFDGYDGESEAGSTAQMAKWLGMPVLLVVSAKSMARSAAAVVHGFETFDPDLSLCGVLFNNAGSLRHLEYLTQAMEGAVSTPCLGGIMRNEDAAIPERHLGLATVEDFGLNENMVSKLADLVEQSLDLDSLIDSLPHISIEPGTASQAHAPKRANIAVARDRAFCFYYADNLDMLEQCGADLRFFSPIEDSRLPENIDGIYLGGGYPELNAFKLSANRSLLEQIKEKSDQGMPIYAECGGFMYLCKTLTDPEGRSHEMAGCFNLHCRMSKRLRSLGYREVVMAEDTILGEKGLAVRGHEFHYSSLDEHDSPSIYTAIDKSGQTRVVDGFQVGRTLGSYFHMHFKSQPAAPQAFVNACAQYGTERSAINAAP